MGGHAVTVTQDNYSTVVEQAGEPVLLDFWAEWCGPCQAMSPIIEEFASEQQGKVVVGKVNVDEERDLAIKFGIRSIPTLVVLQNGQEVSRQVGAVRKPQLVDLVSRAVQ